MVAGLFASGAGPLEESKFPYRGREGTPEAYVTLKEPETWIKNYERFNADKLVPLEVDEEMKDQIPPEMLDDVTAYTEEELRAEAEKELKKNRRKSKPDITCCGIRETTGSFPKPTKTEPPSGCSAPPGCCRTITASPPRSFPLTLRIRKASGS